MTMNLSGAPHELLRDEEERLAAGLPEPARDVPPVAGPRQGWVRRTLAGGVWLAGRLWGMVCLLLLLAVVAAIPIANFLVLGYLLEVEGRVGRSGRWRDAVPLIELAPRLGSIALGFLLWLTPLSWLTSIAADARLIAPGSAIEQGLHTAVRVSAVLVSGHLCLALARGGSLGCFFRPIRNARWLWQRCREGNDWSNAERGVREFVGRLELRRHFWLGVRGYVGAMLWLVFPTALFAVARRTDAGPIVVTVLGGVLLMVVLSWLPLLQAHFAAEDRWGAMFELRRVRELSQQAPLAGLIALLVTLVLALPLYLFKVYLPPRDAMWMVTIVFLASIYPAKVVTGWAYHRAVHRERRAFWLWRWLARGVVVPLMGAYVFLLFFTQFIGEHGKQVLFEHHAFLLPVPFFLF